MWPGGDVTNMISTSPTSLKRMTQGLRVIYSLTGVSVG